MHFFNGQGMPLHTHTHTQRPNLSQIKDLRHFQAISIYIVLN